MDVVINKRKIRDTVRQLVDKGQKSLKIENRTHSPTSGFRMPCLVRNGFGFNSCQLTGTVMAIKQF